MPRARWHHLLVVLAAGLSLAAVALASDPPSSGVNPATGFIEVADATWDGTHWHVRHVVNPGNGQLPQVTTLTAGATDNAAPQIAISPTGGTWVTWWRAGSPDQVFYRRRSTSNGTWSSEALVGSVDTAARKPSLAFDGSTPWFAYEIGTAPTRSVVAAQGGNDPEPLPSWTVLRQTSSTADLQVMVHAESGHLWVTWIDSATQVGWCEFDHNLAQWTTAAFDSYANDSVTASLARIRSAALNH